MKILTIISLCCVLFCACNAGQNSNNQLSSRDIKVDTTQHLSFKGISMGGKYDEFVSQLQETGFVKLSEDDWCSVLKGEISARKDWKVTVTKTAKEQLVFSVVAVSRPYDNWDDLYWDYKYYKNLLEKKYGSKGDNTCHCGSEAIEYGKDYFSNLLNGEIGSCIYYYITPGQITLEMIHDANYGYLQMFYGDHANQFKEEQSRINDI